MKDNTRVKSLDLRGNRIGGVGAAALADMLGANTSVESLCVEWNSLGKDVGAFEVSVVRNDRCVYRWYLSMCGRVRACVRVSCIRKFSHAESCDCWRTNTHARAHAQAHAHASVCLEQW